MQAKIKVQLEEAIDSFVQNNSGQINFLVRHTYFETAVYNFLLIDARAKFSLLILEGFEWTK